MSLINEPLPTPLGPPLAMPVREGSAPTPDEVVAFARDHDVHLVDLKFTDLPGTWQHFAVAARELGEGLLTEGAGFDGSSIRGFQEINESDMLLVPDPATALIDPFHEFPTLSLICDVRDPISGESYSRDPRNVAHKAQEHLAGQRHRRHGVLRAGGRVLHLRARRVRPAAEPRLLRGRLRRGLLERRPRLRPRKRRRRQPRLHEPLAAGLLPRAAARHAGRPARAHDTDARAHGRRGRGPPPRGRRAGPGGDRPALPAAPAHGRHDAAVQVRGAERRAAGGQGRDVHAQAGLRGERLRDAHAHVAVEERRDDHVRRGRLRAAVGHRAPLRRWPARARAGAARVLRPDDELLQAPRARLRGARVAPVLPAQPLGRRARAGVLHVARSPSASSSARPTRARTPTSRSPRS